MKILPESAETFEASLRDAKLNIMENLIDAQKKVLRASFDGSYFESNALAVIYVARKLDFEDLADEMAHDLETEKILQSF